MRFLYLADVWEHNRRHKLEVRLELGIVSRSLVARTMRTTPLTDVDGEIQHIDKYNGENHSS